MTDILVTIRLDSGKTEQYQIAYVPTLEAAYAATSPGTGSEVPWRHASRSTHGRPGSARTRHTRQRASRRLAA